MEKHGEHRIGSVCSYCGKPAVAYNRKGQPVCNAHKTREELLTPPATHHEKFAAQHGLK